jgi:Leucine-rich repeat (LRR) protein
VNRLYWSDIHATGVRRIARSLLDASRGASEVKELRLAASPDLVCMNIMCSKVRSVLLCSWTCQYMLRSISLVGCQVGEPCLCRLAKCLSRLTDLEVLDLSRNNLKSVPDDINRLAKLTDLDLSGK